MSLGEDPGDVEGMSMGDYIAHLSIFDITINMKFCEGDELG